MTKKCISFVIFIMYWTGAVPNDAYATERSYGKLNIESQDEAVVTRDWFSCFKLFNNSYSDRVYDADGTEVNSATSSEPRYDCSKIITGMSSAGKKIYPYAGNAIMTTLFVYALVYGSWYIDNRTHQLHSLRHQYCDAKYPHVDKNCMNKQCLRDLNISISAYEDCFESKAACWNADDDSMAFLFKQCLSQICIKGKAICDHVHVYHHKNTRKNLFGEDITDDTTSVPYMDDHPIYWPLTMSIIGAIGTFSYLCYWKDQFDHGFRYP